MKATETARRKNFHSNPPQIFPVTPPAHSSQPSKKVAAASCRCCPSPLIHPGGMTARSPKWQRHPAAVAHDLEIHPGGITARSRRWSKATPPVPNPNYPRIPEGCQPPILIDTDVHRRVPYPRTTNVPTPPRTNQHPDRPSAFAPTGADQSQQRNRSPPHVEEIDPTDGYSPPHPHPSPLIHPEGMTARSRRWSKATPPFPNPNYPPHPCGMPAPDPLRHRRPSPRGPYPRTTTIPTPPRTNPLPVCPIAFAADGARLYPVCGISRSNATEAPRTWRKSTRRMGVDRSNHPCPPCIHPLQNTLPLSPTP